MEQAKNSTGLSDWGDERFSTPLELLTQPDTDDLRITFFGKYTLRKELVRCLGNRLLIQDEVKRRSPASFPSNASRRGAGAP
jgi:hypothetical protein